MSTASRDRDVKASTGIGDLTGINRRCAELFARLGVNTVSDLLRHLPTRYEFESAESTIADLPMNGIGTARGTLVASRWVPSAGRGKGRFEATLEEQRDRLYLVWFNAAYMRGRLHPGMAIRVQGKTKSFRGHPQMVNPQWERLDELDQAPARPQRLRPIYPATEDLPSAMIESIISQTLPAALEQLIDPLPRAFVRERAMPPLARAFQQAHQPADLDEARSARRRLAYNELLILQLGIAIKRHFNKHKLTAPSLHFSEAIDQQIRQRFPFDLTDAQQQVVREIAADLQRSRPMNRLLQGDVGAGKTVVALYALLMAVNNQKQAALMAPTELLAEQHYSSISEMLKGSSVRVALLTSGDSAAGSVRRRTLLAQIKQGEFDIVVGTQALLASTVQFKTLAVVVVDEQHRFGVLQRAAFRQRGGWDENSDHGASMSPHYLVMTATPIPRTLSLTVFGDLDISTIGQLPPGRTPIATRVVSEEKAAEVYTYLRQRLGEGHQAYVVVPTIDDADKETTVQLTNVRAHTRYLQEKLKPHKVSAVHGQLKRQTRESIMHRFRKGTTQVLVATTVIEVGVDVPNATTMIIEHAERFGLAQLHQLRGRIGRGDDGRRSVCVFIGNPATEEAQQRLEVLAATQDGFRIAERDLEIRGMGDFFGTRQHGMPPLRVARIPEDMPLIRMARRDAEKIVAADPALTDAANHPLRQILLQQYGQTLGLIDVG